MKFALVHDQRRESKKRLRGTCPGCGGSVIAKCGEIRAGHWAHERKSDCDPWRENETEWHRAWKDRFPDDWQEIPHYAEDGEKHIADVKTDSGWALEFQHSPIKPEERRARDAFYPKLVWVVDGTTRKRNEEQFSKAWEEAMPIAKTSSVRKVLKSEGALLRDWAGSTAHVFFDFGDEQDLYWVVPGGNDSWVYVVRLPRADFVERHRQAASQKDGGFDRLAESLMGHIANPEPPRPPQALPPQPRLILPPSIEHIRWAHARRRRRF
jgi:competence protein CoiA